MNEANIEDAIRILKMPESKVKMNVWQDLMGKKAYKTLDSLHSCGTAACLAGHVAVSAEFIKAGGKVCLDSGGPLLGDWGGGE